MRVEGMRVGITLSVCLAPALEPAYQFLPWLLPTLDKVPDWQKFRLGDRIETAVRLPRRLRHRPSTLWSVDAWCSRSSTRRAAMLVLSGRGTRPCVKLGTVTWKSFTISKRCQPTGLSSLAFRSRSAPPQPDGLAQSRSSMTR